MDERAARGLEDADAFDIVDARMGADHGRDDGWVVEQLLHALEGVEGLDQPRIVIVETTLDDAAEPPAVLLELRVGLRRPAPVGDVEASERADAVDAVGVADRLVIRRLPVRVCLLYTSDAAAESRGV